MKKYTLILLFLCGCSVKKLHSDNTLIVGDGCLNCCGTLKLDGATSGNILIGDGSTTVMTWFLATTTKQDSGHLSVSGGDVHWVKWIPRDSIKIVKQDTISIINW